MSSRSLGQCPKCGSDLIAVDVPSGGVAIMCSWCERTYYNPKFKKSEANKAKQEFMRQFGSNDDMV